MPRVKDYVIRMERTVGSQIKLYRDIQRLEDGADAISNI